MAQRAGSTVQKARTGRFRICADHFAVEVYLPPHDHSLFQAGIHLGELSYFAELAKWLRQTAAGASC